MKLDSENITCNTRLNRSRSRGKKLRNGRASFTLKNVKNVKKFIFRKSQMMEIDWQCEQDRINANIRFKRKYLCCFDKRDIVF